MQQAPWLAMWSGIFLTIVVYSFNMFGDAVRDLLDPRLRGGRRPLLRSPPRAADMNAPACRLDGSDRRR